MQSGRRGTFVSSMRPRAPWTTASSSRRISCCLSPRSSRSCCRLLVEPWACAASHSGWFRPVHVGCMRASPRGTAAFRCGFSASWLRHRRMHALRRCGLACWTRSLRDSLGSMLKRGSRLMGRSPGAGAASSCSSRRFALAASRWGTPPCAGIWWPTQCKRMASAWKR